MSSAYIPLAQLRKKKRQSMLDWLPYLVGAGGLGAAYYGRQPLSEWFNRASNTPVTPALVSTPSAAVEAIKTPKWQTAASVMLPVAALQQANKMWMDRTGNLTERAPAYMRELAAGVRDKLPSLISSDRVRISDVVVPKPSGSNFYFGPANVRSSLGITYQQPGWRLSSALNTGPGILAHEAGHAMRGPSTTKWMNVAPKLLSSAGLGTALLSNDERTSLMLSAGGSAAGGLTLADEILASRRGAQLLRTLPTSIKVPSSVFRGTFKGVPSYALMAAAPLLLHLVRKYNGGFAP